MWFLGSIARNSGYLIVVVIVALLVAAIFLPQIRQVWLKLRSEEVTITGPVTHGSVSGDRDLNLRIITVLGKDGIPAIFDPRFVTGTDADSQMLSNERLLGVSINGDHRAYPLNMLSRHEIVNDTVGGEPIAVTW